MRYLVLILCALTLFLGTNACNDDQPDGDGDADADGDGDGDADGDGDGDADGDGDGDADGDGDGDGDIEPFGQDCTEDQRSCPNGYVCGCRNYDTYRLCWCGLSCDMNERNEDCVEPLQPICCWGHCTDRDTCYGTY